MSIFIENLPRILPTKFWFIWPSGFRGEDFFRNQPIRNNNCLWRPCLLTDRDEMSILYRGPAIDASYQVSLHLAEDFQRRRLKCEKLMDERWRMPSDGKSSLCFWQGELKKVCKSSRILQKLRVQIFRNLEIRILQKFGENEINLRECTQATIFKIHSFQ